MTTAWFNPFSGIAGDMALGACLDAGADFDAVHAVLDRIPVDGWSLRVEPVLRGGIAASHAVVRVETSNVVRTAEHINGLIDATPMPARAKARAIRAFNRLAEVEGRLHRQSPQTVHFHEVGGVDAIIDVVGTAMALETLDVDDVRSGPVATGVGMTRSAHGLIPVPAPAVVELLRGAPVAHADVPHELTTPTGAALLATLVSGWGPMPTMTIVASGYGAGTRDIDGRVNAVQLVLGTPIGDRAMHGPGQPLVELAVNVDDATGETLAHAISALLDHGAVDAWITPVLMKKGRPGHVVNALVDQAHAAEVADAMMAETGSFGVRARPVDRWAAARSFDQVDVDGLPIRIKVSPLRTKVEHDDAASVARQTGRPLREVVSLAEAAARRRAEATATPITGHPSDPSFDSDHDPDEPA